MTVYSITSLVERNELQTKEDLVIMSSPIEVGNIDLDMDIPLLYEYDPLHNLLVIAQGINYHVFIGEEQESAFEEKYLSWMEKSKPKKLKFKLEKSSILDNEIQQIEMKNMRLYLVDSEYSMIVFTISISE